MAITNNSSNGEYSEKVIIVLPMVMMKNWSVIKL